MRQKSKINITENFCYNFCYNRNWTTWKGLISEIKRCPSLVDPSVPSGDSPQLQPEEVVMELLTTFLHLDILCLLTSQTATNWQSYSSYFSAVGWQYLTMPSDINSWRNKLQNFTLLKHVVYSCLSRKYKRK